MSVFLTQAEADALLSMEKLRETSDRYRLPDTGGNLIVPLVSPDRSEAFHLDIWRSRINLVKGRIQNRARSTIVLARLDFGGPGHRNPDDQEVPCPHIHVYREGFGDRWAAPVNLAQFTNPSDHWQNLVDFMRFCNITLAPEFDRGLFT